VVNTLHFSSCGNSSVTIYFAKPLLKYKIFFLKCSKYCGQGLSSYIKQCWGIQEELVGHCCCEKSVANEKKKKKKNTKNVGITVSLLNVYVI
jgi:hypothetical protein